MVLAIPAPWHRGTVAVSGEFETAADYKQPHMAPPCADLEEALGCRPPPDLPQAEALFVLSRLWRASL